MILSIIGVLLSLLNLFFYFKLKTFIKNKQKKTSTMIEDCYAIYKASSESVKIHKRKIEKEIKRLNEIIEYKND